MQQRPAGYQFPLPRLPRGFFRSYPIPLALPTAAMMVIPAIPHPWTSRHPGTPREDLITADKGEGKAEREVWEYG